MTSIRPMIVNDLFHITNINLDEYTETFGMNFYYHYLSKWPECCFIAEASDGTIAGYMIGKVEGTGLDWHGHCSAVSVAPEFRRIGLARSLMTRLEEISDVTHNCFYVDLFVRPSNVSAVNMYRKSGYYIYRISICRTIPDYYSGVEDGLDMRKPLPRDRDLKCFDNAQETPTDLINIK
eukprot:GHVR01086759.1.p1 GENE.GHVR01086759.1~~GHVR01086759.1.p1  ORF type:complete len:179 (+),score=34.53 GHVR01086759.1:70-606(+)